MEDLVGSFRCIYRGLTTDFIPDEVADVAKTIIGALN